MMLVTKQITEDSFAYESENFTSNNPIAAGCLYRVDTPQAEREAKMALLREEYASVVCELLDGLYPEPVSSPTLTLEQAEDTKQVAAAQRALAEKEARFEDANAFVERVENIFALGAPDTLTSEEVERIFSVFEKIARSNGVPRAYFYEVAETSLTGAAA
jgi:hypothetical protein